MKESTQLWRGCIKHGICILDKVRENTGLTYTRGRVYAGGECIREASVYGGECVREASVYGDECIRGRVYT